jgi:hypothetical protein
VAVISSSQLSPIQLFGSSPSLPAGNVRGGHVRVGGGQRERGWRAGCGDVQRAPVVRLFMFSWRMHVLCYLEQETKSQNHLWCRLRKNRNAIKSPCLVYKEMLEPAVRAAVDSILVVAGRAGLGFPVKWCGRQIRRFALRGALEMQKS